MNRDKEGVDFEWITKPGDDFRQKRYFSKAEKAKRAASKESKSEPAKRATTKAKPAAKKSSPKRDIVTMARDAIDRSAPTRPKARPGTTRPKARPNRDTATSVETPKVTTTELDKAPTGSNTPSQTRAPSAPKVKGPTIKGYTWEQYKAGNGLGRLRAGLPANMTKEEFIKRANAPKTEAKSPSKNQGSAGRRERRGYAKGGMVKANCGASMKPTQKSSRGR